MKSKKKKILAKKSKAPKKKKVILPKKKKVTVKPIQKIAAAQNTPAFIAESFFKAKIKVIGIGGGGGSIVSDIGRSLNKATFVVADTDVRAFKKRQGIKYFLFGQELTHGLGTGLNTDLAERAAESEKENISKLFAGQDIVILIACLGGGLGSGATKIFAEAAKGFDGITLGIFTLPFKFEGKNKYKIATGALRQLRQSLNVSITIPNERIFKIIQENTAITDAFSMVNKNLIESLESLIDLIYSPGIINIDFADVRAILKGRGNLAFLNTAEASGAGRADKVIQDILHNPLYQNASMEAEKVLFNIAGGANLSMLEVDKISRAISEKNQKAKIIFGISKDVSLKNKIKTTLLMTGPSGDGSHKEPIKTPEKKESFVGLKPATAKKASVVVKEAKKTKKPSKAPKPAERIPPASALPSFSFNKQEDFSAKKVYVADTDQATKEVINKRTIRRNALEAKKAEETEEKKQSDQEKEWEIPAFLRKIKIK